jgi:hypothetical protein
MAKTKATKTKAAKAKPKARPKNAAPGHQFPTELPLVEVGELLALTRGQRAPTRDLAESAWWLIGYGLGQMMGDEQTPIVAGSTRVHMELSPTDIEGAFHALDAHVKQRKEYPSGKGKNAKASFAALPPVPWRIIIQTLLPIMLNMLGRI